MCNICKKDNFRKNGIKLFFAWASNVFSQCFLTAESGQQKKKFELRQQTFPLPNQRHRRCSYILYSHGFIIWKIVRQTLWKEGYAYFDGGA
jgi:hypothetical protein